MAYTMTDDELLDNFDFPTLNSVVESGDETIIQTCRIGHEVIRELRTIGAYSDPHIDLDAAPPSRRSARNRYSAQRNCVESISDTVCSTIDETDKYNGENRENLAQSIESRIAAVVEKHVTALKKDINDIVQQALEQQQKDA